MFDNLTTKIGEIRDSLTKRGALSRSDVDFALREIRIALIEADVAIDVVKSFIESVKERAIGEEVLRSVTPGQMVIKIVHDHLVELLSGAFEDENPDPRDTGLNLVGVPPVEEVLPLLGLDRPVPSLDSWSDQFFSF